MPMFSAPYTVMLLSPLQNNTLSEQEWDGARMEGQPIPTGSTYTEPGDSVPLNQQALDQGYTHYLPLANLANPNFTPWRAWMEALPQAGIDTYLEAPVAPLPLPAEPTPA